MVIYFNGYLAPAPVPFRIRIRSFEQFSDLEWEMKNFNILAAVKLTYE